MSSKKYIIIFSTWAFRFWICDIGFGIVLIWDLGFGIDEGNAIDLGYGIVSIWDLGFRILDW